MLPLTRAREFLKIITSFVGLIKPFSDPDLSLYYTLTRKFPSKESILRRNKDNESQNAENYELGERTLYITVFDHKERTTRVFTRDDEVETIYSTKLDAPLVDVGHHLLEVEIDAKIDSKGDLVCNDSKILSSLREHYQSILELIQYRLGAAHVTTLYSINNSWTMKAEDTISTLQRLREGNGEAVVEKGRDGGRTEESLISDYFMHSSIERERRLLDETRAKWIGHRMDMITEETNERLLGTGVEYRVNQKAVEKKPATETPEEVKWMLRLERSYMELLLIYETRKWEELFWNKFKAFLDQIEKDRVEEKERLTREWRANCWKRLNTQMHAALKRFADVDMKMKDWILKDLGNRWASLIGELFEGVYNPDEISLSKLRARIGDGNKEMRRRLENEIEDTEFRLKRGSDSGQFDQSWDDDTLFNCRYSRSKWLEFNQIVPLEVYSHALEGNKNIIHISFHEMKPDFDVNQFLCNLPWVTSISTYYSSAAIRRDLLFIKSTNNDLIKFAKEIKLVPSSTYIFSDASFYDLYLGLLTMTAKVLISFVAPTSGKSLILRIKHSSEEDGPLEVTLGSTKIQLNPSMSSLAIDDITLYPIEVSGSSESDRFSFVPKVRNDIFIRFIGRELHGHMLHDIELLDEAGLEYMPHSVSLSNSSN